MIQRGSFDTFRRKFFEISMTHAIVLESILAICQAQLELRALPESQPSQIVMIHRGKALQMIQHKLKSSSTSDTLLIAVIGALAYDMIYSDWKSVEANLKGLRHLIMLRGGSEKLGLQGWFSYAYAWAELRWANHLAQIAPTQPEYNPLTLNYPSHPYPPNICLIISKLPIGFQEDSLASLLSTQVLKFLEEISEWTTRYNLAICENRTRDQSVYSLAGMRLANHGAVILGSCNLKPKERLLCIGLLTYIVSFDGQQARHQRGLEDHMADLKHTSHGLLLSKCWLLTWIAMIVAAAKDSMAVPLTNRWLLIDLLVDEGEHREWRDLQQILHKFFWNESLDTRWESCWRIALERKRQRES
jgi:Fungal specific transcription factor domain